MIKKCLVCGAEFKSYPCLEKRNRGKYCSKKCSDFITGKFLKTVGQKTRFKKGQEAWNKKGFQFTQSRDKSTKYKLLFLPNHPFCDKKGYFREHRYSIEQKIGRYLKRNEVVHHKNGNGLDNRLENLELMTYSEHRKLHLKDNVHKRWIK